ncbi:RtcB family protein [Fundidesulfovibrio terrae]|uniref:RtcB family protein n=1 Tax=Fundidesulfovibrio terrae TaxID=2922866 RepID=UPI001FAF9679|nr:RtcB family protein [Fundidesulfovibrio terrae]
MDVGMLEKMDSWRWMLHPRGGMRVPAVMIGSRELVRSLDDTASKQIANVACLPGIVGAAYAMPDAHMGYGFPIGGVAAFDPQEGGVVSAGGVGYDIACGVRTLTTGIHKDDIRPVLERLADRLYSAIPAGVGKTGDLALKGRDMDAMLEGGAVWAVKQGYGEKADLEHIEDGGRASGADPSLVSDQAKKRQLAETGTLGSGNHYLEVQVVESVHDSKAAAVYGLVEGEVVVSIHCGSRGLGHQVASDYLTRMLHKAPKYGIKLPDPELACAPIESGLGREYLAAMRAGINCALANRQVLTHLVREVFAEFFPNNWLWLLYDVSHNTCKEETHLVDGKPRRVFVHRKGATRAWGPNHPELPAWLRGVGQPMPVGGSMGTASYVLAGTDLSLERSLGSSCHGAGRSLSRSQALKRWKGRDVLESLARDGIIVRCHGYKGVSEEAPGAYKDIDAVVESSVGAGIAATVARMRPLACVKG